MFKIISVHTSVNFLSLSLSLTHTHTHTHRHTSISLYIYIDLRHFQVSWCSCQSISTRFPQGIKVFWGKSPQASCACFLTSHKCSDTFGSFFCLRMSTRFFHVVPYTSSWLLLLYSIAVHEWTRVYLSILLAERQLLLVAVSSFRLLLWGVLL